MDPHPYRQAYEANDLERLVSLLADDVVFHSAIITEPGFEGRDSAAAFFAIVLDMFEDNQFTHEFADDRSHLLVADARVLDKPVMTTWRLEFDGEGKIREIWPMARPLIAAIAIAEAVGRAAERAGLGSEIRELAEQLAGPVADLDRVGRGAIADLNRTATSETRQLARPARPT